MLNAKDLIGKAIIAQDSGEKIETAIDLIVDRHENCLLGFLVEPEARHLDGRGDWLSNPKVLPLYLVQAIEADAIIIPWKESIGRASDYATIYDALAENHRLNATHPMTDDRHIGALADFYFDEISGDIEHLESESNH